MWTASVEHESKKWRISNSQSSTLSTCSRAKTEWGTLKCSNKMRPEPVWDSISFQLSIQQKYVAGSSGWWGHLGVQAFLQTNRLESPWARFIPPYPPCSQILFSRGRSTNQKGLFDHPKTQHSTRQSPVSININTSPYHVSKSIKH